MVNGTFNIPPNATISVGTGSSITTEVLELGPSGQISLEPGSQVTVTGNLITNNESTIITSPSSTLVIVGTAQLAGNLSIQSSLSGLNGTTTLPDILKYGGRAGEFNGVTITDPETGNVCEGRASYAENSMAVVFEPCGIVADQPIEGPPPVPVGAIVGGVIGGVVLVALAIGLTVFLVKRHRFNKANKHVERQLKTVTASA